MGNSPPSARSINLALQGGGAHGAFTWGVLERLLEDERVAIEGISGTSAGAINGAVLADGFEKGGREGAKAALEHLWRTVSFYSGLSPYHMGSALGAWSPLALWLDMLGSVFSPYQLNPFNIDPLRRIVAETIDFECLRNCRAIKLYTSATNVNTNRLRVFAASELSADAVLASAALPQLRHAVEIDGQHYWDGGFMGNPALEPLVTQCESPDIVIVQVNPIYREQVPRTAPEIIDRVNEITFNASLMQELRSAAILARLVERGELSEPTIRRAYFHHIACEEAMHGLTAQSKLDASWPLLTRLRESGRETTAAWLDANFDRLGQTSTLDLKAWEPEYYRSLTN